MIAIAAKTTGKGNKEPVFIVKSALKHGGLDYLHISLIALVVILIALAFSLAYFKPAAIVKNCQYGIMNGTCVTPQYNSSQVLAAAGKVLANYANVNSSLSLLPYYSEPNNANVSYLPAEDQWVVNIPYIDPFAQSETFYISMMLSGKNLSLIKSYLESINPGQSGNNTVVSLGTVQIGGKVFCQDAAPFPVYMITDPYAPGAFAGIAKADNLSKEYPGKLNVSYDFIFTNYSSSFYTGYGVQQTQLLGEYLYCAANQDMVASYSANITKVFNGRPLSNVTLYETAIGSGLNATALSTCMSSSTSTLDYQAKLASFYGIVQTPQLVVNCRYSSIPETVDYAINYTIGKLNITK